MGTQIKLSDEVISAFRIAPISTKEMSDATGIHESNIRSIRNGRRLPSRTDIDAIASVLGLRLCGKPGPKKG